MRSLLLALVTLTVLESYKILVYNSKYGHSHSNFLGMIADTLAEAGHNVTSLIPILDESIKDGTEKSHKIYVQPDEEIAKLYEEKAKNPVSLFRFGLRNPIFPFFVGPMLSKAFSLTCKKVLAEPGLIERLKNEKYDVYITENFDVCGIGLSAAIQPKAVIGSTAAMLSAQQFDEFGVEEARSYRPDAFTSHLDVHSFFSRLSNIYSSLLGRSLLFLSRRSVNQVLQEAFGEDYPTIEEQSSNVAYVFTNSEALLDYAAPTSSRIVEIPGIGAKTPKALDEYWNGVMNARSKTVLLSFGSVAESISIPEHMRLGIVKAMSLLLDVTFIWKYETPQDAFSMEHTRKLENVVLTEWMPQVDLLNDKRLSLFITHGGMGSAQELALRGVPGIFIPVFGDQPRNAGMMEYNGFGKVFDKFDLADGEKFAATIREVLDDEKYKNRARQISSMLAKKPFSSKEMLIKTVEFAAEFGPSSALRPQSLDMNFIEKNNVDIIVSLFCVSSLLLYFMLRLMVSMIRRIQTRVAKSKSE